MEQAARNTENVPFYAFFNSEQKETDRPPPFYT
jgi:hypothetical protein